MTHSVVYGHPEITLCEVFIADDMVLGEIGQGISLTQDWFREERLMIAARCLGAAARCIELALRMGREPRPVRYSRSSRTRPSSGCWPTARPNSPPPRP